MNGNTGKEAVIQARDIHTAEKVSRLILAAFDLINGHGMSDGIPRIIPFSKKDSYKNESSYPERFGISCGDVHNACWIACKASFRKAHYYALEKYRLGCLLHSNPIMDLDPVLPIENLSIFPDDVTGGLNLSNHGGIKGSVPNFL